MTKLCSQVSISKKDYFFDFQPSIFFGPHILLNSQIPHICLHLAGKSKPEGQTLISGTNKYIPFVLRRTENSHDKGVATGGGLYP